MVVAAVVGGVAAIGGAVITAGAAGDAADAQREAAAASAAEQRAAMEYSKQVQDPYLKAGGEAIIPFKASLGIGTPEEVAAAYEKFANSPDYLFAVDEARREGLASAKVTGMGTRGSGTMQALERRRMGLATQNLSNWRQAVGTLMDTGSSTARALGNQATGVAGNIGDTLTTGAARASAYDMAGAEAWSKGINDAASIGSYAYGYDRGYRG